MSMFLYINTHTCMFMLDWEVCLFDKEAWVCYYQDSGVRAVVSGRGGAMWCRRQRHKGKTRIYALMVWSCIIIICKWMLLFFSLWTRLCFVLRPVRCFSLFKSAPRCGTLTLQVSTGTKFNDRASVWLVTLGGVVWVCIGTTVWAISFFFYHYMYIHV